MIYCEIQAGKEEKAGKSERLAETGGLKMDWKSNNSVKGMSL